MSLRERQRRFAMAEVERVALDLFAARGYESVSVDDIVAAAGTSQRTFFRYFASKDEVVLAYERYLHERFVAALRSRPASEGSVHEAVPAAGFGRDSWRGSGRALSARLIGFSPGGGEPPRPFPRS